MIRADKQRHRQLLQEDHETTGAKKEEVAKIQLHEDYLASQESEPDGHMKAKTLRSVIDLILSEFPELESKVPERATIHRNGKYVFGLAAYKNHLTLAPWSPRILENLSVQPDWR